MRAAGGRRQKGQKSAAVLMIVPGLFSPYQLLRQPSQMLWWHPCRRHTGRRRFFANALKHRLQCDLSAVRRCVQACRLATNAVVLRICLPFSVRTTAGSMSGKTLTFFRNESVPVLVMIWNRLRLKGSSRTLSVFRNNQFWPFSLQISPTFVSTLVIVFTL